MRVILALGQSGIGNFTLVRKKIKKKALCLNQSTFRNFALCVMKDLTTKMGEACIE